MNTSEDLVSQSALNNRLNLVKSANALLVGIFVSIQYLPYQVDK